MIRRFLFASLLAAFAAFGAAQLQAAETNADTYRQLDRLMDVFEKIRAEYVDEVEDEQVLEAAIEGMLMSLDPHSSYLGPHDFRNMQIQTRGEYGGLGLEVTMENGLVKVVTPIDETPAARADVRSGDYITHIDSEPVMGQTLNEAVEKMRGPVGAPISITVVRPGENGGERTFDVDLTRAKISPNEVTHRLERGTIGYIRLQTFNEQTTAELKAAVREIETEAGEQLIGLVLDLRNNPGGLLDQAISVTDLFLDDGEVVSTRGRHSRDTKRWHANAGDLLKGKPVIVLVNAGSASASEIVAGALQDHRRATVLGTDTFGKGTVQTIIPLGAESALRLTTARYYTPSGRSIQERGIEPDIPVRQIRATDDGEETASAPRRERDLIGHLTNDESAPGDLPDAVSIDRPRPELISGDEPPEDYQLAYALDLLEGIGTAMGQTQSAAETATQQASRE